MPTYAKTTDVSKDRSLAEIEKTLVRYGATGFLYGWSGTDALLGFVLGNRQIRLRIPLPDRDASEIALTETGRARTPSAAQTAYDQAVRQRYRALALYVKATLEAIEAGIVTLEDAFLAYTALPGGGTVGEWAKPRLDAALQRGELPPPLLPPPGDP